jgi:hypothetical protein
MATPRPAFCFPELGSAGGSRRRVARLATVAALALAALPPLAAPALAAPPAPGPLEQLSLAAPRLADDELAGLSGGFRIGGFDLAVGIVSRSVLGQTDGVGERLEVVSRYSVPGAGRLAHDGTTVTSLAAGDGAGAGAGGALPAPGVLVSAFGAGAAVDLGATRLTHRLLDAFVENSDVNRTITRQLDINLEVGGLARRIDASMAARSLRPAVEAQMLYGRR